MSDEERLRDVSPERQQIARDASNVIKQAASILQKEVAASSVSAADMQQKFAATKRVDRGEFKQLADRVRKDVHDLIAIMSDMFTELKTDEVQSLVSNVANDAHEVVDTAMNLVENAPDAATRLAAFGFTTPVAPSGDEPSPGPVGEGEVPDLGRPEPSLGPVGEGEVPDLGRPEPSLGPVGEGEVPDLGRPEPSLGPVGEGEAPDLGRPDLSPDSPTPG